MKATVPPAARAAALALLALAVPARASVSGPGAAPSDPCARIEDLPGASSCGDGLLCSPRDRVALACGLRDAMESRYVFYAVKPALLAARGRPGFDSRRHLDACVADERAIAREGDPLRFYDRMRRCTAAFEDGHLLLAVPDRLPQVALGIGLRVSSSGKIVIANRSRALVRSLEETTKDAAAVLAPGNEVLAIDGRPASEALARLTRLVPGSSAAARIERAVDALTRRDFAYPARRTASLTIAAAGATRTVELAWWVAPGAEAHPALREWLRRTGVTTTALLDWRPEPKGAWQRDDDVEGVVRGDTILGAEETARLTAYRGEGGQLAARLGEAAAGDGRTFCYAQLLTFHTETLASGTATRPFADVLGEFVRGCEARRRDLVLDLRQNEGGYLSHSSALAAMLAPAGSGTPRGALLLRATEQNEGVYRERAPARDGVASAGEPPSEPQRILDAIRAARRAHEDFTPAFLETPAGDASGFGGKVVALVSPACASACDRLAAMLRVGGGAVLVGGPTEGAGGSQQETKDLSARWKDGAGLLALSIPNAAMGVLAPDGGDRRTATAESFFEALAFENRPVQPHVYYAPSRRDLAGEAHGWLRQVAAALRAPRAKEKAAKGPTAALEGGGRAARGPAAPRAAGHPFLARSPGANALGPRQLAAARGAPDETCGWGCAGATGRGSIFSPLASMRSDSASSSEMSSPAPATSILR